MARRYLNVFKNHVVVLVTLIVLICISEFSKGTVATVSNVATGLVLIYVAISYALWLLKAPVTKPNEETH